MVPTKINTIEVGSSKVKSPKARSECTKRGLVSGKAADVFVKGGNCSQLTPDVGTMLDPSVSMFDPPKNDDERVCSRTLSVHPPIWEQENNVASSKSSNILYIDVWNPEVAYAKSWQHRG